jgi:hypothetical protein
LIENHFHVAVLAAGISQDVNPIFRTTAYSNSYMSRQVFRADSLIAQVNASVTRNRHPQYVFTKGLRQPPEVPALG